MEGLEQFYSVSEISARLHISKDSVRKLFRGRPGLVRLSNGLRPRIRIPESLLYTVIGELGYVEAVNGSKNGTHPGRDIASS
jgi:hypothetical protein